MSNILCEIKPHKKEKEKKGSISFCESIFFTKHFFFLLSFCLSSLFREDNGSSYTYRHYSMDHHNAGLKYNLLQPTLRTTKCLMVSDLNFFLLLFFGIGGSNIIKFLNLRFFFFFLGIGSGSNIIKKISFEFCFTNRLRQNSKEEIPNR